MPPHADAAAERSAILETVYRDPLTFPGDGYDPVVVAVLDRALELRWRRWDAYSLQIVPATDADLESLQARHPACTWPECGPGWTDLLDAAFGLIDEAGEPWKASQIKEKFGCLRVYWDDAPGPIGENVLEAAERLSAGICETCGAPGEIRRRGWHVVACDDCEQRRRSDV